MANNNISFVNDLLSSALSKNKNTLKALFDQKLKDTGVSFNQAALSLKIDNKQLEKILDGRLSQLDIINLEKIANFLEIPRNEVSELYLSMVAVNHRFELDESKKKSYILNTFDLSILKKIKFIKNINSIDDVEIRINSFFGLGSIEQYKNEVVSVAYSSGARKSKSGFSKTLWVRSAQATLDGIKNPYEYSREKLLDFIPHIRWHSLDTSTGLFQVIRSLFKLGVSVVYIPKVPDANVRGCTFCHKGKPAIAITNYSDFYPTLFFVLLHELFHVLFDWEEIKINDYHVSSDDDFYSENEKEANEFARDFFASEEERRLIEYHIDNPAFIAQLAVKNNVHPSFYYIFYAYEFSKNDPSIWGRIRKYMPDIKQTIDTISYFDWESSKSIKQINKLKTENIYNL